MVGQSDQPTEMVEMEDQVMATLGTPKQEYLFKILVIGELGSGKTSYIKRYVHNFFSEHYRATIGVDFALKVVNWDSKSIVRLQMWDIAGQERFGNMTRVYYKDAVGAFILFDVTRIDTFNAVKRWKEDLDNKVVLPDGRPVPCVLLGNKCDEEAVSPVASDEQMETFRRENGFAAYFPVSAKRGTNVDESAEHLITVAMENEKTMPEGARSVARSVGYSRGGPEESRRGIRVIDPHNLIGEEGRRRCAKC